MSSCERTYSPCVQITPALGQVHDNKFPNNGALLNLSQFRFNKKREIKVFCLKPEDKEAVFMLNSTYARVRGPPKSIWMLLSGTPTNWGGHTQIGLIPTVTMDIRPPRREAPSQETTTFGQVSHLAGKEETPRRPETGVHVPATSSFHSEPPGNRPV